MRLKKSFFLAILAVIICTSVHYEVFGQETNEKTLSKFSKARAKYLEKDFKKAKSLLNRINQSDPSFAEAWLLQGNIDLDLGDTMSAIGNYENAVRHDPINYPGIYVFLSELYFNRQNFQEVKNTYKKFSSLNFKDSVLQKKSELINKSAILSDYYQKNPVEFHPVNLGKNINTAGNEYINALSSDGEFLIFTRKAPERNHTEDFFVSNKTDSTWSPAELFESSINTEGNEGALSLSPDGQIIFFTGCHRKGGLGSCDIYYSVKEGSRWGEPINSGPTVNSAGWDSQPCLSADGRTLYFVSNRSGGFGKSDIWKTYFDVEKGWLPPVNLGRSVNTAEDEFSPFIHPDRETLFFSSKGHPGMGGFDFYRVEIDENGEAGEPVNLGYPINSHRDEISLVVDIQGHYGYYSTDYLPGEGGLDIFRFSLHEKIRPRPVTFIKGTIYDAQTKTPLQAHFEIINPVNTKKLVESDSDATTGEFLVCIPTGGGYALNARAEGYLFYSEHFALTQPGTYKQPALRNVALERLEVGKSTVLRNVFFDVDQYILKPESMAELEILYNFLIQHPEISVEIGGHTDSTGSEEHNRILSDNRAKAVYLFLIEKGIDSSRLSGNGYGSLVPVAPNDTPEGRTLNRRTEFKITRKNEVKQQ